MSVEVVVGRVEVAGRELSVGQNREISLKGLVKDDPTSFQEAVYVVDDVSDKQKARELEKKVSELINEGLSFEDIALSDSQQL